MADFDERAIGSPGQPTDTIRTGELPPWMVWGAAGVLCVLAGAGLYLGVRGGHPSDVGLTLTHGEALNAGAAASATPAVAMPKDQQWSTLSGPAVVVKSATPPAAAAAQSDSGRRRPAVPAATGGDRRRTTESRAADARARQLGAAATRRATAGQPAGRRSAQPVATASRSPPR